MPLDTTREGLRFNMPHYTTFLMSSTNLKLYFSPIDPLPPFPTPSFYGRGRERRRALMLPAIFICLHALTISEGIVGDFRQFPKQRFRNLLILASTIETSNQLQPGCRFRVLRLRSSMNHVHFQLQHGINSSRLDAVARRHTAKYDGQPAGVARTPVKLQSLPMSREL